MLVLTCRLGECLIIEDNEIITAAVPEPSTVVLMGIGLVRLIGGAARKMIKKNAQEKVKLQ